ncbi:MAG: histidine phosphatase family protein [Kiritimatiellae bacterium]|nr:histidine phosphatase family protein [Kiritimatiellia bacterium]
MKQMMLIACLWVCIPVFALEIHFLRHGETTWNRSKVLQGSIGYTDLTMRGVRMAEATARGMEAAGVRYDRIYASDLLRAYRTADIIAKAQGRQTIIDPRIREMGMGKYEGMRYVKGEYPDDNLKNFFEGTGPYVPTGKGAETFDDVAVRLRAFLDEVIRPLEGKADKVLCVAHSFVLKTLVREYAGNSASDAAKKPLQRNCCVHVLECKNGKFTLKDTGRLYYNVEDFDTMPEPIMVAHRGAGDRNSLRPESSAIAYSNAVDTVCDVVKLDLQYTKDRVIVMHHCPNLKRLTGWDAEIKDHTYAEIYGKARYLGVKKAPSEHRIVRLDEALKITRAVPQFWIDFKFFTPEFAEHVLQTFRDAQIDFSRIMVATFSHDALMYMQKNYPEIRRICHVSWRYRPELKAYTGSMRMGVVKTREKVMEHIAGYISRLGLYGVNYPFGNATPEDVKFLHDSGAKWVSLYFVQNTEEAMRVRSWGMDAFVTDYVTKVRKAYAVQFKDTGTVGTSRETVIK